MEEKEQSPLYKLFDFFAGPFARKKQFSSIEKLLMTEEAKSESSISLIRSILTGGIFLFNLVYFFSQPQGNFWKTLFPFTLYFFFSLSFMFKFSIIDSSGAYREKYFFGWIKYWIILFDVAFFTWIIHVLITQGDYFQSAHFITGQWGLTAMYILFGALMILTDILRYHLVSSLFCGAVIWVSRWVLSLFHGDFPFLVTPNVVLSLSLILFTLLSCLISTNFRKVILRSKKQESLERYIPDLLAKEIIDRGKDIPITGERSTVTILFSDIRNFTTFSESVPPEEVIHFLNRYFSSMIDIVFDQGGMLDKIMGDGLMAIWGSPFSAESDPQQDARNAVEAAVKMREALKVFNLQITGQGYEPINIGIGIHTGYAVMGSIGTDKRKEFTAIGDTVNTASRLEGHTKELNESILISRSTREYLPGDFNLTNMGKISLKGKQKEIEAFSVR